MEEVVQGLLALTLELMSRLLKESTGTGVSSLYPQNVQRHAKLLGVRLSVALGFVDLLVAYIP